MDEDRTERFKAEIEQMRLKTSSRNVDNALQVAGLLAMVAAVVIGFILWSSSTTQEQLDQNELIVLASTMVALAVLGAAVYVVAALKQFLRAWLLRILYERRDEDDD